MKRTKYLFMMMLVFLVLAVPQKEVRAGSIDTSPYVKFSPDGRAWTVEQDLSGYNSDGWPGFWYRPEEADFRTGIKSTLRQLQTGQHYYKYNRAGTVPVGQWRVALPYARCVQGKDVWDVGTVYHGIEIGLKRCGQPYYSGWIAYCADCGDSMSKLIYMSEEAAHTITELPMGMDHYYLCPGCSHLEQGVTLSHSCSAISYNRYRVEYKKNANDAGGYMADSLHMYNNAETFEGNPVTPVRNLTLNSYHRIGYRFMGWNTKPDGTGNFFADGEEIYNLTDENYDGAAHRGVITLYAQWERQESNLVFDAAGGNYLGENPVRRTYGEYYDMRESRVIPPAGYTVFFQTNGGDGIPPVESTRTFERWDIIRPMNGSLLGTRYQFLGGMNTTDTAVAVYSLNSITLPVPQKDNAIFGGWYADEALTRLVGDGGDSYTPTADVTLYALWVELHLHSADNYTAYEGKGAVDLSWEQPDNTAKVYKLYQSADGGVNYAQIFSASASVEPEKGLDAEFVYGGGGEEQTLTIPSSGFYILRANGAQGGDYGEFKGGLGGSVSGKFYLAKDEKLTFLVGGQDGANGGGSGTAYANGGGMTQISSDLKGVLLTAGGGGGASAVGDGQVGGIGSNLVSEGNVGESGMAGGGGGWLGGAAGEHIVHHHTENCRVAYDEDYIARNKVSVQGSDAWSDDEDVFYQIVRTDLISAEEFQSMYVEFYWSNSWVEPILSETTVKIMDQDGKVLKEQDAGQILDGAAFDNGASIHELLELCAGYQSFTYQAWLDEFSSYTFSSLPADFSIEVNPTEGGVGVCRIEAVPVTDGVRNWVHVRLTEWEDGAVYENEDGQAYTFPEIHTTVTIVKGSGGDEYDNWTGPYADRCMSMMISCDLGEDVTGVYVEGISAINANTESGHRSAVMRSVVMQADGLVCNMTEGQVISSKPAYGGSSYINAEYALTQDMTAGCVVGDGSAGIKAIATGMTEGQELKGVKAHDVAAPFSVDEEGILKTPIDGGHVLVTFQPVEDVGSEYYFKAESYSLQTGDLMCISNITGNRLVTGLEGYLYLIDRDPSTVVTVVNAANRRTPLQEERIIVELASYTQYLHLAAVDRAGNISDTVHVTISMDDRELFWQPYTRQLNVDSTVGGRDYENLYSVPQDRTYYVKADGVTPFLLSFESYLEGMARSDYQIDYQILDISLSEGANEVGQRHISCLPHTSIPSGDVWMDGSGFVRQTQGQPLFQDALYCGARRSEQAREVSFYQAFTLEATLSGKTIRVVPIAGAQTLDDVLYSPWERDVDNGIWLLPDGTAPAIIGLEKFQSVELIDRTKESIVVEVAARDELSGVREFYLQVENLDNFSTVTYPADEDGVVRVEVTEADPLFSGDFIVTGYAVDNVGNYAAESWYVTEFALETEVKRILEPHEPVFKCGESGILSIAAWGYVDKVEVVFPDFLQGYSQVFDYGDYASYREDEKIQFMIPLYSSEGGYEITVRAYKGDRQLEAHPVIRTIQVGGSVLDEIRTRLRK